MIYKVKMGDIFKIPKSLRPKKTDDYKENFQKSIREVCGGWFIENINEKKYPIDRR